SADQLNHTTSFTYDTYRRIRSATSPGHNTPLTANVFYDASGTGDDYTYTDAKPTWFVSPSWKKVTNAYDENRRRISTTVGVSSTGQGGGGGGGGGGGCGRGCSPTPTPTPTPTPPSEAAITSFGYDLNGNLTSVVAPNEQTGEIYSGFSTTIGY